MNENKVKTKQTKTPQKASNKKHLKVAAALLLLVLFSASLIYLNRSGEKAQLKNNQNKNTQSEATTEAPAPDTPKSEIEVKTNEVTIKIEE